MESLNRNKMLLLAGASASIGLGLTCLFYYNKQKSYTVYEVEMVKLVLRRFKREYFPIYKLLWTTSKAILEKFNLKDGIIPNELKPHINELVIKQNPRFLKAIAELETKIFKEFDINDNEAFEHWSGVYSDTEPEIKQILETIRTRTELSSFGVKLSTDLEYPAHVTAQNTIIIYKKVVYDLLTTLNTFMKEYTETHNVLNHFDHNLDSKISAILNVHQIKQKYLIEFNYNCDSDIHEQHYFWASIEENLNKDTEFATVYNSLETIKNAVFDSHLKEKADYGLLLRKINDMMQINYIGPEQVSPQNEDKPLKEMQPVSIKGE